MIAIIGGGFIGSALARHLKAKYEVVVFDVNPQHGERCDITNARRLFDNIELSKAEIIINSAIVQIPHISETPGYAFNVNVQGVINLCEIVANSHACKGLIQFGSWHVDAESISKREELYVISKRLQEQIVKYYNRISQKPFVTLRLGTVMGEGMSKETVVNKFIEQEIKGESLTPYKPQCYMNRYYVDIRDVCTFTEKVVSLIVDGAELKDCYNVYYPSPVHLVSIAQTVNRAFREYGFDSSGFKIVGKPAVDVEDLGESLEHAFLNPLDHTMHRLVKGRLRKRMKG